MVNESFVSLKFERRSRNLDRYILGYYPMHRILFALLFILSFSPQAGAGGLATLEFGRVFEGLGRLEVFDLHCNHSSEAERIRSMKSEMMEIMEGVSEKAFRHADIWYQFGRQSQARDWQSQHCEATAPTINELANLFQEALDYQRAGL